MPTRQQLYEQAKKEGIKNRSTMTKDELINALYRASAKGKKELHENEILAACLRRLKNDGKL